jgi:hypothetical protein
MVSQPAKVGEGIYFGKEKFISSNSGRQFPSEGERTLSSDEDEAAEGERLYKKSRNGQKKTTLNVN